MNLPTSKESDDTDKILLKGKELVGEASGALTGALVGGVIGGPIGAGVGVVAGTVIKNSISNFSYGGLSKREAIRIGGCANIAINKIAERLNKGDLPRNDNFFKNDETGRCDAEILFDGVLLKFKNEYEEKKAQYMANIFVNAVFDEDYTRESANVVLNLAEMM